MPNAPEWKDRSNQKQEQRACRNVNPKALAVQHSMEGLGVSWQPPIRGQCLRQLRILRKRPAKKVLRVDSHLPCDGSEHCKLIIVPLCKAALSGRYIAVIGSAAPVPCCKQNRYSASTPVTFDDYEARINSI